MELPPLTLRQVLWWVRRAIVNVPRCGVRDGVRLIGLVLELWWHDKRVQRSKGKTA